MFGKSCAYKSMKTPMTKLSIQLKPNTCHNLVEKQMLASIFWL